jgi:aspartyl-tRNA(Asn)/glutamyl-tRNA(Gln) amidotransferase subunit B
LLVLNEGWLADVKKSMVELPEARRERFVSTYAMSPYDAGVLTMTRGLAEYFDEAARLSGQPKAAANWIMGDLLRFFKENDVDVKDLSRSPVTPKMLADMILLVEKGTISGKIAKTVMEEMYKTGKAPDVIVKEKGLVQISSSGELEAIVDSVISQNADAVAQFRSGKQASLGFLVGQVMKATQGRANPQTVNELLRKRLAG